MMGGFRGGGFDTENSNNSQGGTQTIAPPESDESFLSETPPEPPEGLSGETPPELPSGEMTEPPEGFTDNTSNENNDQTIPNMTHQDRNFNNQDVLAEEGMNQNLNYILIDASLVILIAAFGISFLFKGRYR